MPWQEARSWPVAKEANFGTPLMTRPRSSNLETFRVLEHQQENVP